MEVNRIGKTMEYKRGHYFLTHTQWEDGHNEIEIHHCLPELLYHSCDGKDLEEALGFFATLVDREKKCLPILDKIPKVLISKDAQKDGAD